MNAIEVNGVTKTYSNFTLDNVSFTLPAGTIMGLVGENGAGKSTTIKLIMDAIQPDSGSISVFGKSNRDKEFTQMKQDIGVVLDEAYFPEALNANDLSKIMKATYSRWDQAIYEGYIQKFHLPEKKQIKEYSRGMKMKLAIAVALSHNPKLLILDEAASGLDPMARDEILDVFNDFTRDENHSILLSSHIISDLEKICDYITFLHKGKLVLCEEKDVLLDNYAIVKLPGDEIQNLPEDAVVRKKKAVYGYDALILKDRVNSVFQQERITLEDIILFLAEEDD